MLGASDASDLLGATSGVLALLTFASVILAGVFVASRSRGTKDALQSLGETNAAMEQALKFERDERIRDQAHCTAEIAALRENHVREIANLTGQVEALQSKQLAAFMAQVGASMNESVTMMLDRIENGLKDGLQQAVTEGVEAGLRRASGA